MGPAPTYLYLPVATALRYARHILGISSAMMFSVARDAPRSMTVRVAPVRAA